MTAPTLAHQLRERRAEMMLLALEAVALRLFDERGFEITVDEIASEAQISPRTFYRYFPTKEDVLQVRIDRRSRQLRLALADRPAEEAPVQALRVALVETVSAEDAELRRRWTSVVAATPSVLRGVVGGIQLKGHLVMAEFFGTRLGQPADALMPTMLAAAAGGIVQAAHTQWFLQGADLATAIADGLAVLEHGVAGNATAWPTTDRVT